MTTKLKFTLAGLAGAAVVVGALLLGAGIGYASEPVQRGAACAKPGDVKSNRDGVKYICEEKPGDGCPRWHAYRPQPGPWPSRSTLPCAKCSPSPSISPSPSKSPSVSVSPSPSKPASPKPATTAAQPSTTPVAAQLPITGVDNTVLWIALSGGLMVAGGGVLLVATVRRNRLAA